MSRPRPSGTILRTVTRRLTAEIMADEGAMAAVRRDMLGELNEFADRCGYTRSETREVASHDGLTITGMMSPRTDGEWPAIHQAIREDALDRQRLRTTGDGS